MRSRLALAVVCTAMVAASSARAGTMAERCTGAKERAAARMTAALLGCEQHGGSVADCRTRALAKLATAFGRIESRGSCPATGDAPSIGALLTGQVDELIAALHPTTTTVTVTTSTSCPPPTGFYCNPNGLSGGCPGALPPPLCPVGMACTVIGDSFGCTGASIPCGDAALSSLSPDLCQWGTCPAGMTCGPVPKAAGCGFDCACH